MQIYQPFIQYTENPSMNNEGWVPVIRGYPIDTFYAGRSDSRPVPNEARSAEPMLKRLFGRIGRRHSEA